MGMSQILKVGSRGPEVKYLKVLLNMFGEKLDVNNDFFGQDTENALQRCQVRVGVAPDGVYGPVSFRAIGAAVAKMGKLTRVTDPLTPPPTPRSIISEPSAPVVVQPVSTGINRGELILKQARRFVNLTEVVPNRKWDNLETSFQDPESDVLIKAMVEAGWQPGWAYCVAFVEAVWRMAYADSPAIVKTISGLLNPSSMQSLNNVIKAGLLTRDPVPGAIMFMQMGSSDYGHAGIVSEINGKMLYNIEANTSPIPGSAAAEDREGDGIYYPKKRPLVFDKKKNELWIRGFLNPL